MSDNFDDESDNGLVATTALTPSKSENTVPSRQQQTKAKATKAPAAKVTKTSTRRTSSEKKTTKPAPKRKGRPALKDISNTTQADGNETEEVDEVDQLAAGAPVADATQAPASALEAKPAGKGRPRKTKDQAEQGDIEPKFSRGKKRAAEEPIMEIPDTQQEVVATSKLAKASTNGRQRAPKPVKMEVPDTQPGPGEEVMDIDQSTSTEPAIDTVPAYPVKTSTRTMSDLHRGASRSRAPQLSATRGRFARAGSASDTERGNDPSTRRKLADVTKKLDTLQLRYDDLRDIGVVEAESNFEKLKIAAEAKTKAADAVIARLKQDLEAQKARDQETEKLQRRLDAAEAAERSAVAANKDLKASLTTAQNDIKGLQAKLSASRSGSHPAEAGKTAGNATGGQQATRTVLVGSAEALREADKAKKKEMLYGDLTGLVILNVKKGEDDEDVFDCIQTGRNGTLHFYLSIASGVDSTGQAPSYDETEITYTPLLDEKHDQALMDILPDYLTDGDGICFPRSNVAKFYSRIADTMTKRIEVADEE